MHVLKNAYFNKTDKSGYKAEKSAHKKENNTQFKQFRPKSGFAETNRLQRLMDNDHQKHCYLTCYSCFMIGKK
ncbi:hypothetical protein GCM10011325_22580 [Dyadobacter sediminis]|nr:hypothetical protein GCM10011325_22580 [Dyadobacter sediminis]